MKAIKCLLSSVIAALILSGCAVGPDYHRPKVETPSQFHQAQFENKAAKTADLQRWWMSLNDPELDSLIERAMQSNLDLQIAIARVREARAARGIAVASLLPEIDYSSSYTRSRRSESVPPFQSAKSSNGGGIPNNLFGSRDLNLYQIGFDANWEIDLFGGLRRSVEAATADAIAANENRSDILVSLLAEVARNYVEVRGFQKEIDIAHKNIETQQQTLDLTQVRYKAGLANDLDVSRAAAQLASTQAVVPTLESGLTEAIQHIAVLIGQEPGALLAELSTPAPIPSVSYSIPVGLPSDLLQRRPDIRRSESELAAATARIGEAKSDYFPKILLTGQAGYQTSKIQNLKLGASNFFSFGPSITIPLFTAGRIRSNVQVQESRLDQALYQYQSTILTAFEDVENSLVAFRREQERQQKLAIAVENSQRAVDLSNELYSRGLEDFLTVLDAQRSLFSVEDELVQSERSVVVNLIAVYKALGGGWEIATSSDVKQ
jgi:multidrug efflux system outer membrane protein